MVTLATKAMAADSESEIYATLPCIPHCAPIQLCVLFFSMAVAIAHDTTAGGP